MFISTSFVLECVILISLFPHHPLSLLFCGLLSVLTTSFLTFFSSFFFSHPPFFLIFFSFPTHPIFNPHFQSSFSILIFIPPCSHLLSHLSSPNFLPLIASFLTCTLLLFIPPFFPTLTLLHLIPFPLTLTILLLIPASFNLSPSHLPLLTFFSHLSSAGDT